MKDLTDYTLKEIKAHCVSHMEKTPVTHFCEGCQFNDICDVLQRETQDYLPMMWNFERRINEIL